MGRRGAADAPGAAPPGQEMPSRPRSSPPGPSASEPGRAGASELWGLLSLCAAWWPKRLPPRPGPQRSARREIGAESMLSGLLSVSAAWRPWGRRGTPAGEPPRRGEVKSAILALLVHVDHYEDPVTRRPVASDTLGARTVGLSYREILKRVRAEHPGGHASILTIRSYARDAKQMGAAMPYRRPYSRRRSPPVH